MSVYATSWAKRQRTGDATLKHILLAIADYADEYGVSWPSQERLAFDTELTDRTIRRSLGRLDTLGLLHRTKRPRRADGTPQTDIIHLHMQQPDTESGGGLPDFHARATGLSRPNHRTQSPVNHHRNHQGEPLIQGKDISGGTTTAKGGRRRAENSYATARNGEVG